MIKLYYILLFSSILVAHAPTGGYVLDYTNIERAGSQKDTDKLDSLLASDNELLKTMRSFGFYASTDKNTYKVGETVVFTLENRTKDEKLYISPTFEDAKRIFKPDLEYFKNPTQEEFDKALVCHDPAIVGGVNGTYSSYSYLYFYGIDPGIAALFGHEGFDQPLDKGEKMSFTVKPPQKPGHYRFMIERFSHDPESIGYWGLNKVIYSNAFEVKE